MRRERPQKSVARQANAGVAVGGMDYCLHALRNCISCRCTEYGLLCRCVYLFVEPSAHTGNQVWATAEIGGMERHAGAFSVLHPDM